jgi:hypothetical protein
MIVLIESVYVVKSSVMAGMERKWLYLAGHAPLAWGVDTNERII